MKKNSLLAAVSCVLCYTLSAQTITIYPAKDAVINSVNSSTNYGGSVSFECERDEGSNLVTRSLIEFDLSSVPAGAVITSASLYLYGIDHIYDEDFTDSYLQRINAAWSESTVTWANQPATTTLSQVGIFDIIDSSTQNCTVDVKNHVQQMLDNPSGNFGFMMRLDDEEGFISRLGFASSDHDSTSKHPRLVITYEMKRFAILKPQLDGSYYIAYNGLLRFKYTEKYKSGSLKYNIYDDFHNIVFDDGDLAIAKEFGTNWIFLNLSDHLTTNNYYVLETFDENGRSSFLRFKMAGTDTDNSTSVINSAIRHLLGEPEQ